MRNILAALVVAVSLPAAGQTIGLHLGSIHVPKKDFNNFNPGIYAKWNNGVTVGAYYNSEKRPSTYVGYTADYGRFSLTVGGITGYKKPILPLVIPSVKVGDFRLAFLPQVERGGASVLHLMYEF